MGQSRETDAATVEQTPDRRAAARIPISLSVRITIYPPPGRESDTAKYSHVLAQDISGCGIGIIYPSQLCVGQKIEIEMPDRARPAVISRVDSMDDGNYLIGCQFSD